MTRLSILFTAFIIGFASLLYQTYAIHIVFQFFPRGSDIVALSVASFLTGLGLSALVFAKMAVNNQKKAETILIFSQVILILIAFSFYRDIEFFASTIQFIDLSTFSVTVTHFLGFLLIWIYLFIPAFCLGGCLPLVIALNQSRHEKRFDETGLVYFYDIFGAVLGSLITGFYLIPHLGLEATMTVAILASFAAMIFVLRPHARILPAAGFTACLLAAFLLTELPQKSQITGTDQNLEKASARFGNVLYEEESRFGTVRVGVKGDRQRLFIDYRTMCVIPLQDELFFTRDAEDLLALITLTNLNDHADILGIGLGCGITAGHIARHPKVKTFDLVEINPAVVNAYRDHFTQFGGNILEQENVFLKIQDGAKYLRITDKKYDAIIIDIEEVDIIHSSPLYTYNYFQIAGEKLKPGGILAVWSFYVNDDFNKVLYNTLQGAFHHVYFFPRTESRGAAYFAAHRPIATHRIYIHETGTYLKTKNKLDREKFSSVINRNNTDINTILNPILRKYYDSREFFNIPDRHKD